MLSGRYAQVTLAFQGKHLKHDSEQILGYYANTSKPTFTFSLTRLFSSNRTWPE
jgi:hypothetical protein